MQSSFSILSLFTDSDLVVRIISLALLFASIYSWTIIFQKHFLMKKVAIATKHFEKAFWSGGDLEELHKKLEGKAGDPMSLVFVSAMKEWKKSSSILNKGASEAQVNNLHQRIDRVMSMTVEQESEKLENKIGFLASLGSVAPFLGLFGTVWGIMKSFAAIGSAQSTSLGVIAPGIAMALATTALGLMAAIPAVLAYNSISDKIEKFESKLENFSSEFFTLMSRKIDEKAKK